MQRDWELIRKILDTLEKQGSSSARLEPNKVNGYGRDTVSYHLSILKQAGLIEATCMKIADVGLECVATSLTWDGHEFLDKIRSDTIWKKIKSTAKEKGVELTFDAIKTIASAVIRAAIQ